jgi:hypothetical protein
MQPGFRSLSRHRSKMAMLAAVLAPALLLGACVTPEQRVARTEDRLAAAGFVQVPATTPARQAMLQRLPPHRFLRSVRGDVVTYAYADPTQCNCLYLGTQEAYGEYRRAMEERRLANTRLLAAQIYSDANWNWGEWGPWGGGFNGPFGPGYGW